MCVCGGGVPLHHPHPTPPQMKAKHVHPTLTLTAGTDLENQAARHDHRDVLLCHLALADVAQQLDQSDLVLMHRGVAKIMQQRLDASTHALALASAQEELEAAKAEAVLVDVKASPPRLGSRPLLAPPLPRPVQDVTANNEEFRNLPCDATRSEPTGPPSLAKPSLGSLPLPSANMPTPLSPVTENPLSPVTEGPPVEVTADDEALPPCPSGVDGCSPFVTLVDGAGKFPTKLTYL